MRMFLGFIVSRGSTYESSSNIGKDTGGKTIDITGGAKSARPTKSISFDQFWEAPEWIWRPKRIEMSDGCRYFDPYVSYSRRLSLVLGQAREDTNLHASLLI
jgi:hypothetical protein